MMTAIDSVTGEIVYQGDAGLREYLARPRPEVRGDLILAAGALSPAQARDLAEDHEQALLAAESGLEVRDRLGLDHTDDA